MPFALITGASRGVGRGIAAELASQGYHVFATGRSVLSAQLPETVERIACDHCSLEDTDRLFERIGRRTDALDLVVNSAWGGYERMMEDGQFTWGLPFWEQPLHRWTSMMDAGLRAAFLVSARAAGPMARRGRGLIVNLSFWAARKYLGNAIYGIAKAATDKMSADMAHELRPKGVSVVSLYPGLVRTESVMEAARAGWLNLSNSESPEFTGRVIAALMKDARLAERSGRVLVGAEVARELDVVDVDGSRPLPLTLEQV